MFRKVPKGCYAAIVVLMVIVPFWFSPAHLWTAIMPFWLSTKDDCLLLDVIGQQHRVSVADYSFRWYSTGFSVMLWGAEFWYLSNTGALPVSSYALKIVFWIFHKFLAQFIKKTSVMKARCHIELKPNVNTPQNAKRGKSVNHPSPSVSSGDLLQYDVHNSKCITLNNSEQNRRPVGNMLWIEIKMVDRESQITSPHATHILIH